MSHENCVYLARSAQISSFFFRLWYVMPTEQRDLPRRDMAADDPLYDTNVDR